MHIINVSLVEIPRVLVLEFLRIPVSRIIVVVRIESEIFRGKLDQKRRDFLLNLRCLVFLFRRPVRRPLVI